MESGGLSPRHCFLEGKNRWGGAELQNSNGKGILVMRKGMLDGCKVKYRKEE